MHLQVGSVGADRAFVPCSRDGARGAAAFEMDLSACEASEPADRACILKLVKERIPGGVDTVNEKVRAALAASYATAEATLIDEFDAKSLAKSGVRSYKVAESSK